MSNLLLLFLSFRAWTLRRTDFQRDVLWIVAAEIAFVLGFYPLKTISVLVGIAAIILLVTLTGTPFEESALSPSSESETETL